MGELELEKLANDTDRAVYIKQLINDIDALERMLKENMFQKSPIHIGAEQEFCLVNDSWEPSNKAVEILKEVDLPQFTSELTLYNLEINLDPLKLEGRCFSNMHKSLDAFLEKAEAAAEKYDNKVILTGILPTLRTKFLGLDYMTPLKRYQHLNEATK